MESPADAKQKKNSLAQDEGDSCAAGTLKNMLIPHDAAYLLSHVLANLQTDDRNPTNFFIPASSKTETVSKPRRGKSTAGFEYSFPTREREEEMRKSGLSPAGSESGRGLPSAVSGARTQVGWSCCRVWG